MEFPACHPHDHPATPKPAPRSLRPRRPWEWLCASIVLAFSFAMAAHAQQVTATLSPPVVAQGQTALFSIIIEGPSNDLLGAPAEPAVPGLAFLGPQSEQSFMLRNNVASSRFRFIWQVTAQEPGRYTIPPQSITVAGQTLATPELTLEVRDGPPPSTSLDPILQLHVHKTDLFVGEVTPITLTALFHRRTQVRNYDHPKLPRENFVVKRFPPAPPAPYVDIGGERFQPVEFTSSLSALREGDLVVGPATMENVLVDFPADAEDPARRSPQAVPPSFFQRGITRQVTMTSDPVRVRVKPLPLAGRPADFAGAVGRFMVMSRLGQPDQNLRVGDPISVDLIVTGQGNFDTLSAPLPAVTEGWKPYPTKITQENRGTGLEAGAQVWNQILVPQQQATEVPGFVLSFFDPTTAEYQTVRSAPIPVTILPEESQPEPNAIQAPTKDFSLFDTALPEEKLNDILSLRPTTARWQPLTPQTHPEAMLWAAQAAPAALLLAFIGVGLQRRQRERLAAQRAEREGRPRLPSDIRRDLRQSGLSRRQFYTLAREFIDAAGHYAPDAARTAGLNGDLDSLFQRQALYCYAAPSPDATAPIPRPEQKESLATLEKLTSR